MRRNAHRQIISSTATAKAFSKAGLTVCRADRAAVSDMVCIGRPVHARYSHRYVGTLYSFYLENVRVLYETPRQSGWEAVIVKEAGSRNLEISSRQRRRLADQSAQTRPRPRF